MTKLNLKLALTSHSSTSAPPPPTSTATTESTPQTGTSSGHASALTTTISLGNTGNNIENSTPRELEERESNTPNMRGVPEASPALPAPAVLVNTSTFPPPLNLVTRTTSVEEGRRYSSRVVARNRSLSRTSHIHSISMKRKSSLNSDHYFTNLAIKATNLVVIAGVSTWIFVLGVPADWQFLFCIDAVEFSLSFFLFARCKKYDLGIRR